MPLQDSKTILTKRTDEEKATRKEWLFLHQCASSERFYCPGEASIKSPPVGLVEPKYALPEEPMMQSVGMYVGSSAILTSAVACLPPTMEVANPA